MSINTAQKIENVLLEKGLINQIQYDEIKRIQLASGKATLDIIKENSYISLTDLFKVEGEMYAIPYVDPREIEVSAETLASVPEKIARRFNLVPIHSDKHTVKVAMSDPFDLDKIQYLERITKKTIQVNIAVPTYIIDAIDKQYGKTLGEDVTEAIEKATETSTQKLQESLQNIEQAEEIIKVSPVAKIVLVMLEYGVKSGASDIHIEPSEHKTRIRYRIDGVLTEKFPLPKEIHNSIVARIKILANMQIDERRKPLDGKFKIEVGPEEVDLRVSTLPTIFGEKCVIRLLRNEGQIFELNQLGLWGEQIKIFNDALSQTTGIILVTGPTGSGKTVTLAASLQKLNSPKVNIITLEDPAEITLPGVNQVQINPQAGLTFASGLRAILRQDPNIIMVGEIRDVETARLAIQAALTGHLVLATLHTNSSAGAIPRLLDMGVEPFLLSSTINVVLAQRLARKICPYCREAYEADEIVASDIKKVLGERLFNIGIGDPQYTPNKPKDMDQEIFDKQFVKNTNGKVILYKGKGCKQCGDKGYKGRIGIYEVMKITPEIQKLTEINSSADSIQNQASKEGLIRLVQDGYLKALWGITTIEEVLTVADES